MESIKKYTIHTDRYVQMLDNIFRFCPDGVVCKNKKFQYISVNKIYCKLFSQTNPQMILGSITNPFLSVNNTKLIHDADIEIKNSLIPITYILNIENDKLLNITSSPILDNGEFCGILSIIRDITQEEVLKEKFVERHFKHLDAERQLQAQRETFVASVGHDLKNPTIAQIRGIELLLEGGFGSLTKEQKEILEMILDSCRYMNGMLSSLLETYRNYGGAVKLNFTEFSLNTLVNECVSEMLYVARDKEISILQNGDEEISVCADRVQIKRVIMNLLSNAIKYAYKNSTLKLFIKKTDNSAEFSFENKSPYIPREKQKSIFARYVSYAGVHKELGIGLGLYASNKIIESHLGEMFVKSYEDNRNSFGFLIPTTQNSDKIREVYL